MATSISTIIPVHPPVIPNFGWYYGLTPQRLPEDVFTENQTTYPPGRTTSGGGGSLTLPASVIPTSFGSLSDLQASFEPNGTIVIDNYITSHTTVTYTGLAVSGGFPSFTGCVGGSGTYALHTPIYDPRFYVDQMPLDSLITFDAIDQQSLGLPVTVIPAGVSAVSYQWDFGNGQTGYGPFASTTYTYNIPSPSIQTSLTVQDSLGRTFSCAQRLNLKLLSFLWSTSIRVRPSNTSYR